MTVHVEQPAGIPCRLEVGLGETSEQGVASPEVGKDLHAPAHRLYLAARSRPSRRPRSTGSMRVRPSVRASPSTRQNMTASTRARTE